VWTNSQHRLEDGRFVFQFAPIPQNIPQFFVEAFGTRQARSFGIVDVRGKIARLCRVITIQTASERNFPILRSVLNHAVSVDQNRLY